MLKIVDEQTQGESELGNTLDDLALAGARQMLKVALKAEVAAYVESHAHERDEQGRAMVVRNGKAKSRKVTCGAGTLEVQAPRVNDKRVDANGQRERFASEILPPYMRRSPRSMGDRRRPRPQHRIFSFQSK